MLFQVKRASMWSEKKPCEKCIPIRLINVDRRTFKSPEEYDERFATQCGSWLSRGSNHRITEYGIARDLEPVQVWGIEINSLEELMNFKKELEEDLIITTSYIDGKTPTIEIYDDYIE